MLPAKSSSNSCKVRNMIWNGWDLLGHVNGGTVWNNECLFFNSGAFHSPGLADLHEARAACVGYVFFFAKTVGKNFERKCIPKDQKDSKVFVKQYTLLQSYYHNLSRSWLRGSLSYRLALCTGILNLPTSCSQRMARWKSSTLAWPNVVTWSCQLQFCRGMNMMNAWFQ